MTDEKYGQKLPPEVLNSRGLTAKRDYVLELEGRTDAEALSLLAECLCDESWYLRDLAEQALLKLGDVGAETLLPLVSTGLWYTRTSAARALGRMGYRPAVPELITLTEDGNATVADSARDALVAIGQQKGAFRIAHALHRVPPDRRKLRVEEIASRDHGLADRIARMMRREELMSIEHVDSLSDDHATVRASEEGVEWEVLTGPVPPPERPGDAGAGNG